MPTQISNEQKASLHEVADLMLQIYETLVEMRYLDPKGIIRGPHNNIPNPQDQGIELDPSILYLYSILPYIDIEEAGESDFFHGGTFVDFRNIRQIEQGRDPFYADPEGDLEAENGAYMRPWATPLSQLGNHGTGLIYDARLHRIWAIDQEGWGTTDPALCSERTLKGTPHEVFHEVSDWGSDSEGEYFSAGQEREGDVASEISEHSSEFWSDESSLAASETEHLQDDQHDDQLDFDEGFEFLDEREQREAEEATRSENTNRFDHIRSRPAGDVLRSIIQWYRELKEIPGGEHGGGEWMEREVMIPLFLQNGWPDEFDGDAFEIDQARTYCAQRAKYFAEDPLRQVECYEGWLKYDETEGRQREVNDAKSDDEKWTARLKLWQAEQKQLWNLRELETRREIAALRCPGGICQQEEDLPLWELEMLRVEQKGVMGHLDRRHVESDELSPQERRRQKKARVYTKAYDSSAADAQRLCPGRTFESTTGIKSLGGPDIKARIEQSRDLITSINNDLLKLREWTAQLPEPGDIPNTRRLCSDEIEQKEQVVERLRQQLKREEKWLAEHGESD